MNVYYQMWAHRRSGDAYVLRFQPNIVGLSKRLTSQQIEEIRTGKIALSDLEYSPHVDWIIRENKQYDLVEMWQWKELRK